MHVVAISLIAGGTLFNCWAIGFLLFEKRKEERQRKAVGKALEEINYQLSRARMMSPNQR